MGTPFFSLPSALSGDPKRFERSVFTHPTLGLPIPTNGYHDAAGYGGSIAPAPETIAPQAVALGGVPLRALPGKSPMAAGPWLLGDLDPANAHLHLFLANFFRRYSRTDLGNGALLWRYDLDQAEIADRYLGVLDWTDVLPLVTAFDGMIGGFQLGAQAGQNLAIQFPVGFGSHLFHGTVVQAAGSGSTPPVVTGVSEHHFAADAIDGDIWVEVVNVDGANITIRSNYGGASAPGSWSANQVYVLGTHPGARLYLPNGFRIGPKTDTAGVGSISNQARLYWPVGATLTNGDRFRVPKRGAEPAFTLPDQHSISSVNSVFVLDSEEIRTEGGWQVTAERGGFGVQQDVHGRQGGTPRATGDLTAVATATREITDLAIQQALYDRQRLSLFIDAEADEIIPGGSNLPYRAIIALPGVQPSGQMYGPDAGAQNTQEAATLTAGLPDATVSYAGHDFDQHLSVLIWTDTDPLPFTPPST
jgi:hypothetical protein